MNPVSTQTMSRLVWISFVDVERQPGLDRIGAEILDGRQQPEHHLQAVEQHGHDEVRVGDGLRAVAHVAPSYLSVAR